MTCPVSMAVLEDLPILTRIVTLASKRSTLPVDPIPKKFKVYLVCPNYVMVNFSSREYLGPMQMCLLLYA